MEEDLDPTDRVAAIGKETQTLAPWREELSLLGICVTSLPNMTSLQITANDWLCSQSHLDPLGGLLA